MAEAPGLVREKQTQMPCEAGRKCLLPTPPHPRRRDPFGPVQSFCAIWVSVLGVCVWVRGLPLFRGSLLTCCLVLQVPPRA